MPLRRVGKKFSAGRSKLAGSLGSYPAITANARATSLTERAIGPMVSKSTVSPSALALETRPNVGRRRTTPHKAGGTGTVPPVSDPIAPRHTSVAAGAAAPLEDP